MIKYTDRKETKRMLLEFICSNHKSISDKIVFSALAGTDTAHSEKLLHVGQLSILNSAVIYGANGSGKSNFLDAISFVKTLVVNSISNQPGQGIPQKPHKLNGFEKNSEYSLQFVKNNTRFAYGFVLNKMLVKEEYLYYFPNGRQVKIFERNQLEIIAGSKFRGKFSNCKDILKPNRLLLSCAANFTAIEEIESAFRFFLDDLVIYNGIDNENWMDYSLHQIHDNPRIKSVVIKFMQSLGIKLQDINVKIDKMALQPSEIPPFLSDEFKNQLLQNSVDAISARLVYEKFDTDLMSEESAGIQKLIAFLCPFVDIMINGKVLFCDELEANLHESVVYELIQLFTSLRLDTNPQIFFTTHDTSLLNLNLFRRDQIWFTELSEPERATSLYSLAEIKNVRKEENISKGYISGRYGAIPMLNVDFAKIVSDL